MRKILKLVVFMLVVWCLVIPGNSRADVIQRLYSINTLTNNALDQIGVKPFDPTIGTLDEVRVSIEEIVVFSGEAKPWSSYSLEVDQLFLGLLDKYFDFSSPIRFLLSGTNPSDYLVPVSFGGIVRLDFKFTAISDFSGLADITNFSGSLPPATISFPFGIEGKRSDFLKSISPVDEIDIFQTAGETGFAIYDFNAGGTMQIMYIYTPTPTPVPEPATMLLLGSGLLGLAGYWRKKFFKK